MLEVKLIDINKSVQSSSDFIKLSRVSPAYEYTRPNFVGISFKWSNTYRF